MTSEFDSIIQNAKNKRNLRRQNNIQLVGYGLVWLCGFLAIAAVFWIIGYVLSQGLRVIDLAFLTTRPAGGVSGEGGI